MIEDGVAMCEFYAWFEAALADPSRRTPITELTIDEKLAEARARRPGYVGPSFATIAAFNANGAMPHYRATPESHATIEGDGLLLIDSGAQYLGGTTDITRMWPIGRISEAQRRDVTTRPARHDGAQPHALPARHARADARRDRARAALGSTASTTATAPATASATSSTSTKGRRRSRAPSPSRRWRCSRG